MRIINNIINRNYLADTLEEVGFAIDHDEWLITKSNSLCNSSNHHFKTDDKVVELGCLLVVEIPHHLQNIEKEALPVREEKNRLHTYELEERLEWLQLVFSCHVE